MIAGQVDGNDAIAAIFDDIADLLELEETNPFRIRAYRNAARTLRAFTGEVAKWRSGEVAKIIARGEPLPKLPGIGVDLAGKINEIVATGDCALHQRLRATLPHGLAPIPIALAGAEAQLKTLACLLPEYDDRQAHVVQKVTAWRTCDSRRPFS